MLRTASHSAKAAGHPENEDHIVTARVSGGHAPYWLGFVADGQGGRADGAIASRTACETALKVAANLSWNELSSPSNWDQIFTRADQAVREHCDGMTTLIGLAVNDDGIFGASVGDSKVYLQIREEGDFSLVELTERQEKNPPVGGGCQRATSFYRAWEGNLLFAVTDGVWKYTPLDTLNEAASAFCGREDCQLEQLEHDLASRNNGNLPDDFSILAFVKSE